ncbi:MAG: hypothetical protein FD189_1640 [Elusimicrobia bacterium]|nr:MAG: hypothetical protein FD154_924 [Elusimicrobiota bacterium]KAF0154902.1 MAG: hypothetical protein FD189_1640 [Elusimicrobiota bacterium]
MASYYKKFKADLDASAGAGIITPEQAAAVYERALAGSPFASFRAAHWIGAAAGLFVALGIILIVASNWDKIDSYTKLFAFLLLFAGMGEAAIRLDEKPAAAVPLEMIWFFMPILGIGLYAQIFNLSGDPVKPYLVWAALASPAALLSRRPFAAYLCSALLFFTLYYGTLSSNGMLALTAARAADPQPLWHWGLALAVLAGGAAVFPGRKLSLPLGASVIWLFIMMLADTAIKLRSSGLILLSGMSLAVLWLTYGSERDDERASLPLKVWLGAVYFTTFFWHYGGDELVNHSGPDTSAGGALAWLLFAGGLLSVVFRPQRLLPAGSRDETAGKVMLAASMLCSFFLFDANEATAKAVAITANLLLAAFGTVSIISGARDSSEKQINLGVAVLTLTAVTRFIDIFGTMLKSGMAFIVTGVAFGALAYFVNKGRKALIESVKK